MFKTLETKHKGKINKGVVFEVWEDYNFSKVVKYKTPFITDYIATLNEQGELIKFEVSDKDFPVHHLTQKSKEFILGNL